MSLFSSTAPRTSMKDETELSPAAIDATWREWAVKHAVTAGRDEGATLAETAERLYLFAVAAFAQKEEPGA